MSEQEEIDAVKLPDTEVEDDFSEEEELMGDGYESTFDTDDDDFYDDDEEPPWDDEDEEE